MIKNIRQALKEPLKAKIFDKRGVTLIELLVTVAISAIFLPVIYSAFITGYKLYEKINIEGQLRDDADYVTSMILNTFYSTPFDVVDSCGSSTKNCIDIKETKETTLTKQNNTNFYDFDQKSYEHNEDVNTSTIKLVNFEKNGQSLTGIQINDQLLETSSNFEGSTFSIHCKNDNNVQNCETNGTIELHLQVKDDKHNKVLHLTSEFGF